MYITSNVYIDTWQFAIAIVQVPETQRVFVEALDPIAGTFGRAHGEL